MEEERERPSALEPPPRHCLLEISHSPQWPPPMMSNHRRQNGQITQATSNDGEVKRNQISAQKIFAGLTSKWRTTRRWVMDGGAMHLDGRTVSNILATDGVGRPLVPDQFLGVLSDWIDSFWFTLDLHWPKLTARRQNMLWMTKIH